MRRQHKRAQDLRRAVDCLPRGTRLAMLEGLERNDIIVGAYTDGSGGVCPMLAAHRSGGRTSLASFARTWDRYTEAKSSARHATRRELNTLRALQAVQRQLRRLELRLITNHARVRVARALKSVRGMRTVTDLRWQAQLTTREAQALHFLASGTKARHLFIKLRAGAVQRLQ